MPKSYPQLHSELLQVRVTPDMRGAVTRAASKRGLSLADYVRAVLSEAIHGPHLPKPRAKTARKGGRR